MAVSLISMIIYTDISMLELLSLTKQIHNADKEPMVAALLLSSLPSGLPNKFKNITYLHKDTTDRALLNKLQTMIGNATELCFKIINEQDQYGKTKLTWAVINNDINKVKSLLERGAHVDMPNKDGFTPLITAALYNNLNMVKILLEYKADANAEDKQGGTPLAYAIMHKNLDIVTELLNHKAYVNKAVIQDGYTPLMLAIISIDNEKDKNEKDKINQMNIIKALIDKKVDPQQSYKHIKNKHGQTALDTAKIHHLPDIVKLLEA